MGRQGSSNKPRNSSEMIGIIYAAENKQYAGPNGEKLNTLIKDFTKAYLSDGTANELATEYDDYDGDVDAWFETDAGKEYLSSVTDKLSNSITADQTYGGCGSEQGSSINTKSGFDPCADEFDGDEAELYLLEQIENASVETAKERYSAEFADDQDFSFGADLFDVADWVTGGLLSNIFGPRAATEGEKAAAALLQATVDSERKYTQGRQISFKEQCFLLTNIVAFSSAKTALDLQYPNNIYTKQFPDIVSYGSAGNRSIIAHGEPFSFINKLTQSPTKQFLYAMRNDELSTLQPQIRLFKIISDDNGNEYEVEIKFDSHLSKFDLDDLLSDKSIRGKGVGIKSFNFSYEGSNVFSIKKTISAKLVLFANTFGELLQDRESFYYDNARVQNSHIYKYTDLALKTGGNSFLT